LLVSGFRRRTGDLLAFVDDCFMSVRSSLLIV
jgi:hypothetical protein